MREFLLPNQCNIKQTSDENKEKYQLGDLSLSNVSFSELTLALTFSFLTLYDGQFTSSTQLLTLNYLLYSPTDAAPQFL